MKKTTGTRLFASVFVTTSLLTLTGGQVFSQTHSPNKATQTTFHCIRNGATGYATVARRGDAQTGAMITWEDTSFGSKFTPRDRCAIVARRFNQALSTIGNGSLGLLKLTYGEVNDTPVICYIRLRTETCNGKNLILTLHKSESGQENDIIKQLKDFSVNGTGTPLSRGINGNTTIAEFGKQINSAFESGVTQKATPELDQTVSESPTESMTSPPVSKPAIQP